MREILIAAMLVACARTAPEVGALTSPERSRSVEDAAPPPDASPTEEVTTKSTSPPQRVKGVPPEARCPTAAPFGCGSVTQGAAPGPDGPPQVCGCIPRSCGGGWLLGNAGMGTWSDGRPRGDFQCMSADTSPPPSAAPR